MEASLVASGAFFAMVGGLVALRADQQARYMRASWRLFSGLLPGWFPPREGLSIRSLMILSRVGGTVFAVIGVVLIAIGLSR